MYIDKNKAFRAGLLFLGIVIAIVLVVIISLRLRPHSDPVDETTAIEGIGEQTNASFLFSVSGTWYADTDDGDVLSLMADGRYTSSAWLRAGFYDGASDDLRLTDDLGSQKSLRLVANHSSGSQVLVYSDRSTVRTYYSDRDTMQHNKKYEADSAALTADINTRNLFTILCSDVWTGETANGDLIVDMTDSSVTLTETNNSYSFTYTLSDVTFDQETQTFNASFLSSADRSAQTLEGSFAYVNAITVHLGDNNSYTLYFLDGSSFGFQYRPFVKTVQLTLEAATAASPNCEKPSGELPPDSGTAAGALPPSDATDVAEDPDNWDATGTKMIANRESSTADDGTVTTTTTYTDGTTETQVSRQTTIESGNIELMPENN